MKVLIAEFKHETNTSAPGSTKLAQFKARHFLQSGEVLAFFKGARTEINGFYDVLSQHPDVEIIPVVATEAMPGAPVSMEVFSLVQSDMLNAVKTHRPDAILFALHGAMVTEESEDGEGEILAAIRKEAGDIPVFITLDLHANITEKMIQNCDAMYNCDCYPHTDLYDRALEAAEHIYKTVKGELKPCMSVKKLPMIMPYMPTEFACYKTYLDMAHEFEKDKDVLTVNIAHGFAGADIFESGVSVVAVTNNDQEKAERIAGEISGRMWRERDSIKREYCTIDEAIDGALAVEGGPVLFSDGWDNPGGGSASDGTRILRRLLERDVQNVALATIVDPESAKKAAEAGVGNEVELELGGKASPELLGEPIRCKAYVKHIFDGKYVNHGPYNYGVAIDIMLSAVVVVGGVEVIVATNRTQPYDREIFIAAGIHFEDKKIVVLKTANHFRADFGPYAKKIFDVKAGGMCPQELNPKDFKRAKRPIYPFDEFPE